MKNTLPDDNAYTPADITQGDRDLATHCETYLCTRSNMTHADRMARITQSIADYRDACETRARNP